MRFLVLGAFLKVVYSDVYEKEVLWIKLRKLKDKSCCIRSKIVV